MIFYIFYIGIPSDIIKDTKVPAYIYDSRQHSITSVQSPAPSSTLPFYPLSYEESHTFGDPFHEFPFNPIFSSRFYHKGEGIVRRTREKFTGNFMIRKEFNLILVIL